jgi:hypothetical protein
VAREYNCIVAPAYKAILLATTDPMVPIFDEGQKYHHVNNEGGYMLASLFYMLFTGLDNADLDHTTYYQCETVSGRAPVVAEWLEQQAADAIAFYAGPTPVLRGTADPARGAFSPQGAGRPDLLFAPEAAVTSLLDLNGRLVTKGNLGRAGTVPANLPGARIYLATFGGSRGAVTVRVVR